MQKKKEPTAQTDRLCDYGANTIKNQSLTSLPLFAVCLKIVTNPANASLCRKYPFLAKRMGEYTEPR